MIVPAVKREEATGQSFYTDTALSLCVCEEYADKACTALCAFLPQCSIALMPAGAFITVQKDSTLAAEACRMDIRESGVVITCADYLGLRNALAVFAAAARLHNNRLQLPELHIEDIPTGRYRSVMLDLASTCRPIEDLYRDLILMAKARMNRVHLYLFDRSGVALQLDSLPCSCRMPDAYTKQQMRELCAFADALGLTVIPEFDMPGHSQKLREVFPEFCCDVPVPEGKVVTSVCTGHPALYTLYETLIHELLEIFPGPYFHMGGDEVEMLDLNVVCCWDDCSRCRRLREEQSLADRQEQYYYFVKRIHEMVKKEGRTLIMWSDQLDCPRGAQLPQDILMHFWRVAHPGRGPYIGCSMQAQAALGYDIINSFYPETYTFTGEPAIMSAESLSRWHWDQEPDCAEEYAPRILGGELCAWGYSSRELAPYMDRFLPPSIVLMADKFWNNVPLEYTTEYRRGLTCTLLGAGTPENLDIFEAIGNVLPPADGNRCGYPENVSLTTAELEAVLAALSQEELYIAGDADRAKELRACVEYVLQARQ